MILRQHLRASPVGVSDLLGCDGRAAANALAVADQDEFVRTMLADIPPAPPRAAQLRALNSGRPAAAE